MRLGIDGRKIPESRKRGGVASIEHGHQLGMDGLFFRTVLDVAPTLDPGVLKAIRQKADEFGMYVEMGLGKVNPYALPETPEVRGVGDGDTVLAFRRMMEACAAIGCRELWVGTANFKGIYPGRYAIDRFRTDIDWADQLAATEKFLFRLKPIALDLGIHINLETHEEITSFEVVRLVETVGPEAFGIVLDTSNGLQRLEHPSRVAERVAPYVRQTHFKDLAMRFDGDHASTVARACGQGVIDFGPILQTLARANPDINISIECTEPFANGSENVRFGRLDVEDPTFVAAHPDATVTEYAEYAAMIRRYEKRLAAGEVPPMVEGVQEFGYKEAVAEIAFSARHLRGLCETMGLPLAPKASSLRI